MLMRRQRGTFFYILIFVLAQLAWFSLLGLWIYWYVSNYLLLSSVGEQISSKFIAEGTSVFPLVVGLILLVFLSVAMSLIFIYLNKQMNLTRLYDTFISNVTHELKSPLSSIQLYLETLKSRPVTAENQHRFFSIMLKDIDRLNKLINSILYLSALDYRRMKRKMTHDYAVYDAGSIFHELVAESAEQFKLADGALQVSGNLTARCVVDRGWFKIVFDNLIDNAIKYSLDSVQIAVRFLQQDSRIIIEFSDKGIGIAERDQQKIFNKFQRLERQEVPSVKGTGLGLYWVREIVKMHGGRISVHSDGVNRGTTFRIELPVYPAARKKYIDRLLKRSRKEKAREKSSNE